jgi:hypothetical protein
LVAENDTYVLMVKWSAEIDSVVESHDNGKRGAPQTEEMVVDGGREDNSYSGRWHCADRELREAHAV